MTPGPASIPSNLRAQVLKLHSVASYVWAIALAADDTHAFRLALGSRPYTIYEGTGAPFPSFTYYPFPATKDPIQLSIRGDLQQISLTLWNVNQELSQWIDASPGLLERECRIFLFNSALLGDASNATPIIVDLRAQIMGMTANADIVQLTLGHWNLLRKRTPSESFARERCGYAGDFRGDRCGFDIAIGTPVTPTLVNGYNTGLVLLDQCDFTLTGENGCEAHGAVEKQLGAPERHPRRGRFFPCMIE